MVFGCSQRVPFFSLRRVRIAPVRLLRSMLVVSLNRRLFACGGERGMLLWGCFARAERNNNATK